MFVLGAADTLAGVASVASQLTYTLIGMTLVGTTETYDVIDQEQLPNAIATIYTVPGSTTLFIKVITVVNNDTAARTFRFAVNGTAAVNNITPTFTIPAGGMAIYNDRGWTIYTSTGLVVSGTPGQLLRRTLILNGTTTFTPGNLTRAMYVEAVGAGAGGGGCATAITNAAAAGGGGSGAYSAVYSLVTKTSYTVAVGGGGAGGTAGANNGSVGGDTSFDTGPSICTAKGGSGGIAQTVAVGPIMGGLGGAGGLASGGLGDIKNDGMAGLPGWNLAAAQAVSGSGGNSYFGGGSNGRKTQGAGAAAALYGAGGAGGCIVSGGASVAGGNGSNGLLIVWEFA